MSQAQRYPLRTPRRKGYLSLSSDATTTLTANVSLAAFGLFVWLADRADRETGIYQASIRSIAGQLPISRNTATKYLRELETGGWIEVATGPNDELETQIQILNWAGVLSLDTGGSELEHGDTSKMGGSEIAPAVEPPRAEIEPAGEPPHHGSPATTDPKTYETSVDLRDSPPISPPVQTARGQASR